MRFQTKMTMTYAAFLLLAGIVIAFAYHAYSIQQYRATEERSLAVISQQVSNQVDDLIKPMETRMQYILSDIDILQSIQLLASQDIDARNIRYIEEARSVIQKGLNIDYVVNDFYRVIIFNPAGEIISRRSLAPYAAKTTVDFGEMPWLAAADAAKGAPVLVSAHTDNWGARTNPDVFSLVKAIQGNNLGYIEVQRTIEDLQNAISLPREDLQLAVFVNGSELLYASASRLDIDALREALDEPNATGIRKVGDADMLLAKSSSSVYGIRVILLEDMATVHKNSNSVAPITVAIAFVFCGFSLLFVFLASHFLSKPVRQLREVMEQTQLETIGREINISRTNNELEALGVSYQHVLERLQQSIIKEKRMSVLHLEAQFDLLQAQVNPHFLYNVLNVITQRGLLGGDEEICDMCASLAAMLRYSTNTKQRYSTIGEELQYLDKYFYLLKCRYEHRITFTVTVPEKLHSQVIPKIALQQIVENSINHGYEQTMDAMQITLRGWREGDRWYICISDNGQGFGEERLREVRQGLADMKTRIMQARGNMEMEIGGMGLVNTYARLLLLYGNELTFKLENGTKGVNVLLGAPVDNSEGNHV